MELTEIITILSTALGSLTAVGGVGVFMYRRQNKRLKELEVGLAEANVDKEKVSVKTEDWHLWKEQLEAEREHVKFQDERIKDLLAENDAKDEQRRADIKEWEARFTDQTKVLRDTQREFRDTLNSQIAQEREIADLREENAYLRQWLCKDAECDHGKPPRERLRGKRFDASMLRYDPEQAQAKKTINPYINNTGKA